MSLSRRTDSLWSTSGPLDPTVRQCGVRAAAARCRYVVFADVRHLPLRGSALARRVHRSKGVDVYDAFGSVGMAPCQLNNYGDVLSDLVLTDGAIFGGYKWALQLLFELNCADPAHDFASEHIFNLTDTIGLPENPLREVSSVLT